MVRVEVPGHVLQHFWDLANVQADVRQKSAVSLVTELKSAQDAHGPDGADVEMGDADAGAGAGGVVAHGVGALGSRGDADAPALTECSPVLTYALKRLARGLGSGRSGARQGFALALTAALRRSRS
jgi:DNA polymerase phi